MERKKRQRSAPAQIACGVIVNLLLLLVLLSAASWLVLGGIMEQGRTETAAVFANAAAALIGGFIAARRCTQRKLPIVMASCCGCLLVFLMGNLLFLQAPPTGFLRIAGPALGGGLLAALLASGKPKTRRRKL